MMAGPSAVVTEFAAKVKAALERRQGYKFNRFFPDCLPDCDPSSPDIEDHVIRGTDQTPICRVLYRKHLALFRGGATYRERLFLKANRVGGTAAAAYEVTCHLSGLYPHWWEGRRFEAAGDWWAAGRTGETTRNYVQYELLGPSYALKTGMIPAHLIRHLTMKSGGVAGALDQVWVRHASGGTSLLQFKSFDQQRTSFEGTAKQGYWLDEEADEEIATECMLRTMTTNGIGLYTFTPLEGLTPFVEHFIDSADMLDDAGTPIPAKSAFWDAHPRSEQEA